MTEEFFIPKLGQTVEEVTLVKWLVADGAKVSQGQEVMEVETDKGSLPGRSQRQGLYPYWPLQRRRSSAGADCGRHHWERR